MCGRVMEGFTALIGTLPSLEAKVLTTLRLKQDQRLLDVARETDLVKRKFALVRLIVNETVNLSHSRWKEIFQNYSTDYVKRMASNPEDSKQSSLTYGEIDFFSFANILERAQPSPGDIFVDLGHGIGKGLVCAAVLFGHLLSKSFGVEIVETLNSISQNMIERYHSSIKEDPLFSDHQCQISVEQGDLLCESISTNWTQADIVFANSTCFDEQLMQAMARVAEQMKPGARFITLTKQLPSPEFILLDRRQYVMSWGEATSFLHIRRE